MRGGDTDWGHPDAGTLCDMGTQHVGGTRFGLMARLLVEQPLSVQPLYFSQDSG